MARLILTADRLALDGLAILELTVDRLAVDRLAVDDRLALHRLVRRDLIGDATQLLADLIADRVADAVAHLTQRIVDLFGGPGLGGFDVRCRVLSGNRSGEEGGGDRQGYFFHDVLPTCVWNATRAA